MLGRRRQDWQNQTATAALAGYAEALELIFSNAAGLNLDSPASTTSTGWSIYWRTRMADTCLKPIPPPHVLRGYQDIMPDGADELHNRKSWWPSTFLLDNRTEGRPRTALQGGGTRLGPLYGVPGEALVP